MSSWYREDVEAALQFLTAWDGGLLGITLAYLAVRSWTEYSTPSAALRHLRAAPPNPRVFDLGSLPKFKEDDADDPLVIVRGIIQPKSAFDRWRMAFPLSSERVMIVQRTHTWLYHKWTNPFGRMFDLHALFFKSMKEQLLSSLRLIKEKKILPVGKEINVICICKRRGVAYEIMPCRETIWSDMTIGEIEADMASKSDIHFWCSILFGTISVGILGYAIHRKWLRWQEQRERRRQAEELQRDNGDDETRNVADGEQCVVCLMRRRRVAFIPCVHFVCCPRCALTIVREASPMCPVCRMTTIRINAP